MNQKREVNGVKKPKNSNIKKNCTTLHFLSLSLLIIRRESVVTKRKINDRKITQYLFFPSYLPLLWEMRRRTVVNKDRGKDYQVRVALRKALHYFSFAFLSLPFEKYVKGK